MKNIDKSRSFVKLAEARVNSVLKKLKLIENLANPKNYTYDEGQAKKIIRVLRRSVKDVENAFLKADSAKSTEFSL
jgi:hypothetical protein